MIQEPHPDTAQDFYRLKQIQRGGRQAIEDKAIAEYMRVYDEEGREAAEKIFFKHFNKDHGKQ
jgi:hypothetical protein